MRGLFFLFVLFVAGNRLAYSQIADFSLSLTATAETCPGNGQLAFEVTGATPGSAFLFFVYALPNEEDEVALVDEFFCSGLPSGDYKVVAVQSLGTETKSVEAFITIDDDIQILDYELAPVMVSCASNGSLGVTVLNGTAVSYEIIEGPVIVPPQPGSQFDNLPAGTYKVRVVDNCGQAVVKEYTLQSQVYTLQFGPDNLLLQCDTYIIKGTLTTNSTVPIAYPLTLTCTVYPPGGAPAIIYTDTADGPTYYFSTTFYPNQAYSYKIVAVDACGHVFESSDYPLNINIEPVVAGIGIANCLPRIVIANASTVTVTEAPPTYPFPTPNVINPTGNSFYIDQAVSGDYTILAYDICGNPHTLHVGTENVSLQPPQVTMLPGCTANTGSVKINNPNGMLEHVFITTAPTSFDTQLPFEISGFIFGFQVSIDSLPAGYYEFTLVDGCGNNIIVPVTIEGAYASVNYTLNQRCGVFDIQLSGASYSPNFGSYWIQRYNPASGIWTHPFTGEPYTEGAPIDGQVATYLVSNGLVYNFPANYTYRIIAKGQAWTSGTNYTHDCVITVAQFDAIGVNPTVDAYAFACSSGGSTVVVNASGNGPFHYSIISKNGTPFILDNGNSQSFANLEPAIYTFQVLDDCGNVMIDVIDTSSTIAFGITSTVVCGGTAGSLQVPYFSFLSYKWWKEDAPGVTLSNTSTLPFPSFDSEDFGTYSVLITYEGSSSTCVSFQLNQDLTSLTLAPKAGTGSIAAVCSPFVPIDLFDYLQAPYDTGGNWTSLSGDTLDGSVWTQPDFAEGIHQFTYTVSNLCGQDAAAVTLNMNITPQIADAAYEGGCAGSELRLVTPDIPGATFAWVGPNGFTSSDQNPVINAASTDIAGVFEVTATRDGCVSSPVSVTVGIDPLPVLEVRQECVNGLNLLMAETDSANEISWSGPAGFTATGTNVRVPAAGFYEASVTTPSGCRTARQIEALAGLCDIPRGISPNGDGKNDEFDLSGLPIRSLEILNRYGTVVFDKLHYVNEWKGQDKCGNPLPTATYFYYIELDNGETKAGWVYLTRN